jgi:hypothetical protein
LYGSSLPSARSYRPQLKALLALTAFSVRSLLKTGLASALHWTLRSEASHERLGRQGRATRAEAD